MKASTRMKALMGLVAILMFTLAPDADARVYKCKLPNGQTEYKDKPCSGGNETQGVYSNDTVTQAEYDAAAQVHQRSKAHLNQFGGRTYSSQSSTGSRVSQIGNQGGRTVRRTCK
ncbi:MAG: DUF4124 domain-containing protein [Betaproteobacteria bacterium]|nr:DUF4124 domain-containing protein [Betaproteobacteria bacterium]